MDGAIWMALVRHLLTALGGVLVAKGYTDADTMNSAVGAAVTLGGVGWSIVDKKKR